MTKQIPLTQGKFALVDDEDHEWLSQWKWTFHQAGKGYAYRNVWLGEIDGKSKFKAFFMHRLIANTPDGFVTDHIDRNGLNNQRANLRIATFSQNIANQSIRSHSQNLYKGIQRVAKNKWVARVGGREIRVSSSQYFATQEEAAREYDRMAREMFGEFALLNFPD